MISKTTRRFREAYARLPEHVQRRAREAYRRFKDNPNHPSLRFKQVHAPQALYAARVGLGHRALAIIDGEPVKPAKARRPAKPIWNGARKYARK